MIDHPDSERAQPPLLFRFVLNYSHTETLEAIRAEILVLKVYLPIRDLRTDRHRW